MKRGFTLIELMVVIAVIGILASIILVSVNGSRAQARDAKRVSDLRSMITVAANLSSAAYATSLCSGTPPFLVTSCASLSGYNDPNSAVSGTTCSKAPFSRPCQYTVMQLNSNTNVTTESFEVCAYLEQDESSSLGFPKGNIYISTINPTVTTGCP